MQSSDLITPLAIQTPICINGDKNIPSQNASGTDTSSINLGFLPITSEPLDDGGIAPERTDFNGMFYLSTDQRVFLQNGGLITFNASVSSNIGGYPKGAVLSYIDGNGNLGFVKSLIENNTKNFVTTPSYIDGTNWKYVPINNPPTNSYMFDGQWVTSNQTLTTATSGTRTLDFSSYLPNDSYVYNVLFSCTYGCNSNSIGVAQISEYNLTVARGKRGDGNNNGYFCNAFICPVPASKTLTFVVTAAHFSGMELNACAYRRVGTNS